MRQYSKLYKWRSRFAVQTIEKVKETMGSLHAGTWGVSQLHFFCVKQLEDTIHCSVREERNLFYSNFHWYFIRTNRPFGVSVELSLSVERFYVYRLQLASPWIDSATNLHAKEPFISWDVAFWREKYINQGMVMFKKKSSLSLRNSNGNLACAMPVALFHQTNK